MMSTRDNHSIAGSKAAPANVVPIVATLLPAVVLGCGGGPDGGAGTAGSGNGGSGGAAGAGGTGICALACTTARNCCGGGCVNLHSGLVLGWRHSPGRCAYLRRARALAGV